MNLDETVKNVVKNWKTLTKSINDKDEFVIIAEKDEEEDYGEYKECLGVKQDGTLIWSFLSGCSCNGEGGNKEIQDRTIKVFVIDDKKTVEEFFEAHKCEPNEGNYKSY